MNNQNRPATPSRRGNLEPTQKKREKEQQNRKGKKRKAKCVCVCVCVRARIWKLQQESIQQRDGDDKFKNGRCVVNQKVSERGRGALHARVRNIEEKRETLTPPTASTILTWTNQSIIPRNQSIKSFISSLMKSRTKEKVKKLYIDLMSCHITSYLGFIDVVINSTQPACPLSHNIKIPQDPEAEKFKAIIYHKHIVINGSINQSSHEPTNLPIE